MLDEHEWAEVMEAHDRAGLAFESVVGSERQRIANVSSAIITEAQHHARCAPLLDAYERLTGFRETNPTAVWHHRVALYGPPCAACGRPLRTPQACWCAACGAPRDAEMEVTDG
jgi:hypothetical protein